ncbi:hypothetical protein HUT06_21190 [Actinomadura sp. NAK00032]|uniref:hypothetical protein n=1 Tax=Actinomadura sp. NAK00032 TaxID=2742128 RepID=UPI001590626F|nr:hypothetical protein [Actinomadura sp. NAK00032]QKW36238.1 hypothetical protein HUT06_21190 [Actinomadura sp. NAK00032]
MKVILQSVGITYDHHPLGDETQRTVCPHPPRSDFTALAGFTGPGAIAADTADTADTASVLTLHR